MHSDREVGGPISDTILLGTSLLVYRHSRESISYPGAMQESVTSYSLFA